MVVPGLCVSSYLRPACEALTTLGFDVRLAVPQGWAEGGEPVGEPESVADLARPIAEWLAREGVGDLTLVGQSVGSQIAAHVARMQPALVSRLVLQGPVFDPAQRSLLPAMAHWLRDVPAEKPSLLVSEAPEWARAGPRRVARTLRLALADELETTVDALPRSLDVDVVVGAKDPLSTAGWRRTLTRGAGRNVEMAGLPHSTPHAAPNRFAAVMAELLDPPARGARRRPAAPRTA